MKQSLAEWISQRAGRQRSGDKHPSSSDASDDELDRYRDRVKKLLSIADDLTVELDAERSNRLNAENKLEQVRSELKESKRDRRNLKRTLRRASRELNSLRHGGELPAVTKLRQQLDQIQNQVVVSFGREQNLRVRAETELKTLQQEAVASQKPQNDRLPSRKSLINERIEEERGRRRKAEKENRNVKRKLRHVSRTLNNLRRDHSKCGHQPYQASSNGSIAKVTSSTRCYLT